MRVWPSCLVPFLCSGLGGTCILITRVRWIARNPDELAPLWFLLLSRTLSPDFFFQTPYSACRSLRSFLVAHGPSFSQIHFFSLNHASSSSFFLLDPSARKDFVISSRVAGSFLSRPILGDLTPPFALRRVYSSIGAVDAASYCFACGFSRPMASVLCFRSPPVSPILRTVRVFTGRCVSL